MKFVCTQRGCDIKARGKKHPDVCPVCNNPQNVANVESTDDGDANEDDTAPSESEPNTSGDALTGAGKGESASTPAQ